MKYLKFVAILAVLMVLVLPTTAFAAYETYEQWGPRAKNFYMKFHSSETLEFESLQAGQIDIVEWPLTKTYYDRWQDPSYGITIVGAGPEWGMYILDINNNETMPDGSHNPTSDPALRRAIWYLIDRDYIASTIFEGMAAPLWAPVAAAASDAWKNPAVVHAYDYNVALANATLDANGYDIDPGTGKRKDPHTGEVINLKVYARSDHEYRRLTGEWLCTQLDLVKIGYTLYEKDSGGCYVDVMTNKDFNTYTGGWGLGVDVPDTLYGLFHSSQYWHPGWCPNYGNYHDDISDALLDSAFYAETMADAIPYVLQWQERYINPEWLPAPTLVSNIIYHAYRNNYGDWASVDPLEAEYKNLPWKGIFNSPGRGIGAYNNFWTFMNMYPEDTAGHNECPRDFAIRWGWKVSSARKLNPIYGSWVWDWAIMNWIYDTWIGINPLVSTEDKPWMAYQFTYGTWNNPDNPQFPKSTYVTIKIRDDIYWSDGTPMTIEDFRWMIGSGPDDLVPLLRAHDPKYPYPWWYSSVADVHHVDVIDSQTMTVYYNVRSYLALHWVGGLPLMPKHIWYPIVTTGDPTAHLADPNLIGNGPYKLVNYQANIGAALTRNNNYFALNPIDVRMTVWNFPTVSPTMGALRLTITNYALKEMYGNITVTRQGVGVLYSGNWRIGPALKGGQYGNATDIIIGSGFEPPWHPCDYIIVEVWEHQPDCTWHHYIVVVHIEDEALSTTKTITVREVFPSDPSKPIYPYYPRFHVANTIREDVTCDKFVNIKDAVLVNGAFASKPGDLNWDARTDIFTDGYINIKDAVRVNGWFGWPNMCPT
jgi:ABC-type oligopeptide transport system substrate-binding subunit